MKSKGHQEDRARCCDQIYLFLKKNQKWTAKDIKGIAQAAAKMPKKNDAKPRMVVITQVYRTYSLDIECVIHRSKENGGKPRMVVITQVWVCCCVCSV